MTESHAPAARLPAVGVLHALTFVVALCSFAYELVYAELLTVVFGGTVTQYGLTVGLFFSSLGVGSFASRALDDDRSANFLRVEFLLALVGPAGFLLVLLVTAGEPPAYVPFAVVEVVARLPVVAVGLLSGFELPLLTALVEREAGGEGERWLAGLRERTRAAVHRLTGAVFHVSRDDEAVEGYSTVLGMDYLGGLAGALLYVFLLYPRFGLVPTVFVLGLLNGLAALAFVARFSTWSPLVGEGTGSADPGAAAADGGEPPGEPPDAPGGSRLRSEEARALVLATLLLTATYAGVVLAADRVEAEVESYYFANRIEAEYPDGTMDATVSAVERTRYQRIVRYERTWTGTGPNPYFAGESEECLRLGTAVQLCESWADSYHQGLVDVPMTLYENGSETDVLLLGGGDWIAADHLREYGVTVDHVDLDGEFMQRARERAFYARYHDDAYEYDRLNTTVADAWRYLGDTNETYDLILLDLPGAENDDLLRLYSTEFYDRLRTHLEPDGVVGTWVYSRYGYASHRAAYVETVRAAGFDRHVAYSAWEDLDADGETERVERFYLLSPDDGPAFDPAAGSAYVRRHADRYRDLAWEPTPSYRGVRPNRVLHPNYDVLVRPSLRNEDRHTRGWWPW
jgi:spermidine synthase